MRRLAKLTPTNLVIIAILALLGLTVGLRGVVPQATSYQVNATRSVSSITDIGPASYRPGFKENFTDRQIWSVASTQTVNGSFSLTNNSLVAQASFKGGGLFQAFQVLWNANVNLESYPFLSIRFLITPAAMGFGIRFQGIDNLGNSALVQTSSSALEHQSATGVWQTVQVNVESYAYSLGYSLRNLTRLYLYLEASSAFTQRVTVQISSIGLFNIIPQANNSNSLGTFQYILVGLQRPSGNMTLDRIFVSFTIGGSGDLLYVPHLVQSANASVSLPFQVSTGLSYIPKASGSYEVAVVHSYGSTQSAALPYPPSGQITIVIEAIRGSIASFSLRDLTLVYSSEPTMAGQTLPQGPLLSAFAYYLLVILVLPISIFVLIYKFFYGAESVSRKTIIYVGLLGMVLRIAVAPITGGFDLGQWIYYTRLYFESGTVDLSYYPVLPPVYFLFLVAMGPYFLLRRLGFTDVQFFVHPNNMVEATFAKIPMLLADVGLYTLLVKMMSGRMRSANGRSLFYASAFLLNPFAIYISAAWGQIDSIMMLCLLAGLWLTESGRNLRGVIGYTLSGVIKLFGFFPLMLLELEKLVQHRIKTAFLEVGVSFLFAAALVLPFANLSNLTASLFLRLAGVSGAAVSQTALWQLVLNTPRSAYSSLALFLSLAAVSLYYLRSKVEQKMLRSLILIAISIFTLDQGAGPQWSLWLIPLIIIVGYREKKEGLIYLSYALGIISFLTVSLFLQSFGGLITGEYYQILSIETLPVGLGIYAVETFVSFGLILAYLFGPPRLLRQDFRVFGLSLGLMSAVFVLAVTLHG